MCIYVWICREDIKENSEVSAMSLFTIKQKKGGGAKFNSLKKNKWGKTTINNNKQIKNLMTFHMYVYIVDVKKQHTRSGEKKLCTSKK